MGCILRLATNHPPDTYPNTHIWSMAWGRSKMFLVFLEDFLPVGHPDHSRLSGRGWNDLHALPSMQAASWDCLQCTLGAKCMDTLGPWLPSAIWSLPVCIHACVVIFHTLTHKALHWVRPLVCQGQYYYSWLIIYYLIFFTVFLLHAKQRIHNRAMAPHHVQMNTPFK